MIDTHVHLYDEKFDDERDIMIQRAIDAGVNLMYMPNCDSSTIEPMLNIESKYPENCIAMMGIHPCYIKENYKDELTIIEKKLNSRSFAAIGEIGLDYYWDKSFVNQQKEAFRTQIEWSIQYNRPIVIHTREATQDTIEIVKEYTSKGVRGVFHCFSGSLETAKLITKLGFFLGIGGVVTYPKAGLQEVIAEVDMKHLVLETDAPYLTPVPHRGKRNESSYLQFIANKIASVKNLDVEEVVAISTENARILFS